MNARHRNQTTQLVQQQVNRQMARDRMQVQTATARIARLERISGILLWWMLGQTAATVVVAFLLLVR